VGRVARVEESEKLIRNLDWEISREEDTCKN
jgi:hypothetical protein